MTCSLLWGDHMLPGCWPANPLCATGCLCREEVCPGLCVAAAEVPTTVRKIANARNIRNGGDSRRSQHADRRFHTCRICQLTIRTVGEVFVCGHHAETTRCEISPREGSRLPPRARLRPAGTTPRSQ